MAGLITIGSASLALDATLLDAKEEKLFLIWTARSVKHGGAFRPPITGGGTVHVNIKTGKVTTGKVGEKAATAIADFIVVDMFANYCTGTKDAKGAVAEAERQLKRIYR